MAKGPVRREVDGQPFEFYYLSPKVAIRVLARLSKLIGEPLGAVADSLLKGSGKDGIKGVLNADLGNLPPDLLNRALKSLTDRLDENQVIETLETILERVYLKGEGDLGPRPARFETDFEGKVFLLFKVVRVALEVNYGDFLGASLVRGGASAPAARLTT